MIKVAELEQECNREGLHLHWCSEHHLQIMSEDSGTVLVDVWPTTGKFRWHDASPNSPGKKGSAREAVKQALYTQRSNAKRVNGSAAAPVAQSPASDEQTTAVKVIEQMRKDAQATREAIKEVRQLLELAQLRLRHACARAGNVSDSRIDLEVADAIRAVLEQW